MIGVPIPSTDVTIRDDNGNELPIGEIGEICVSGPQVMKGYWNAPDETAKVIRGGWMAVHRRCGLHAGRWVHQIY